MSNSTNHRPVIVENEVYVELIQLKGELQSKSSKNISINTVIRLLLSSYKERKKEEEAIE